MDSKSILFDSLITPSYFASSKKNSESMQLFPSLEKLKSPEKNYEKEKQFKKPKSNSIFNKQNFVISVNELRNTTDKGLRAKIAYKALDIYANSPSYCQKELKIITEELFSSIFCPKAQINKEIKEWIYEKYDFSAGDTENFMPYFYIADFIFTSYSKDQLFKENLKKENLQLSKEILVKNSEINTLKAEIMKNNEKNEANELKLELETAESKFKNTKEAFEKKIKDYTDIIHDLNTQVDAKEQQLRLKEAVIASKDKEYNTISLENRKYMERLQHSQIETKKAVDFTEILLSKIKNIKGEYIDLEEKLRIAENKNIVLSVRAAEGYNNLTPRPNFESIEKMFGVCSSMSSTREKTEWLIKNYLSQLSIKKKINTRNNVRKQTKT